MRTFTTTFSVFDSKKKTIWEDTEAHETKLVTVFIKEVSINLKLLGFHKEKEANPSSSATLYKLLYFETWVGGIEKEVVGRVTFSRNNNS